MFFNDMSGQPHSRGSASASTSDARDDGPSKKRRRIQRACDMCRLKKSTFAPLPMLGMPSDCVDWQLNVRWVVLEL